MNARTLRGTIARATSFLTLAGVCAAACAAIAWPATLRAQDGPALSATYMLLKPIDKNGIADYSRPDTVECYIMDGAGGGEIAHRGIEIRRGDRVIVAPVGAGPTVRVILPTGPGWDYDDARDSFGRGFYSLRYVTLDGRGEEHRSAEILIPVRVDDSKYERRTMAASMRVDRYTLCLFKFDRAELGPLNERIVRELIVPYIGKDAEIEVIGHMDIIGLAAHNMRLSENRARSVVNALHAGIPGNAYRSLEGRGVGEGEPLFTNALPEGRFYNRATQVIVYTPVASLKE
jgi:outer membrane protein OmpA-like peptidoglycan-associated protein